jgi:hypothetical protein
MRLFRRNICRQRRVVLINTRLLFGYDQVSVGISFFQIYSFEICSLCISSFIEDDLFVMFD